MPENVTYMCFFNTWSKWMDGVIIDGDKEIDYDFVDQFHKESSDDVVLNPFNEDEARRYFAKNGYENVTFIYPGEDDLVPA